MILRVKLLGREIISLPPLYEMHPLNAQYVHGANQAKSRFAIKLKLTILNLRIFSGREITTPYIINDAAIAALKLRSTIPEANIRRPDLELNLTP